MSDFFYLIPVALLLGGAALTAFLWSLHNRQYEDLDGAAERILFDEDRPLTPAPRRDTPEQRHRDRGHAPASGG